MKSAIRPSSRDAILNAAIALFAESPGASMSEIAIHAGVGRATLHRHFPTKDDLMQEITRQSIIETDEAVLSRMRDDQTALEQLEAMFQAIIPLGDRYHFLYRKTVSDADVSERYQNELEWLGRLVAGLKSEGVIAADVPDNWAVTQLDQLVWSAWRAVGEGKVAAADAPDLALRTFTRGLG